MVLQPCYKMKSEFITVVYRITPKSSTKLPFKFPVTIFQRAPFLPAGRPHKLRGATHQNLYNMVYHCFLSTLVLCGPFLKILILCSNIHTLSKPSLLTQLLPPHSFGILGLLFSTQNWTFSAHTSFCTSLSTVKWLQVINPAHVAQAFKSHWSG